MSILVKVKNWILSITKKDIIYSLIIALLIGVISVSVYRCSKIKSEYKNNIEALNDTIHYYKAKNGDLVASKLAFESDIKTLKLLNKNLYNEIDNLKSKAEVMNAVHFDGVVEYEIHDTTYIVKHDTIINGFTKDFAFNNKYRSLEGNVNYKNDTVGVNINKDEMYFDYTVAIDKKNNIYISSSNPYIKYNEISGFQVPKQKRKRWSLGPSVNFGYDPINNKPSFSIGASVSYGIIQW